MAEITNLYSYKGADPHPLPEKLRLSDGTTRTDPSTFIVPRDYRCWIYWSIYKTRC